MSLRHFPRLALVLSLAMWLLAARTATLPAAGPPSPTVRAELNYTALAPGQQAVVAVVTDIPAGLHAQSHRPSEDTFIAFELSPSPQADVQFLAPEYPAGQDVTYPALGKLNVYTGRVVVYLPLVVAQSAKPGEIQLTGSVRYQQCDDRSCYPPGTGSYALTVPLVASGADIRPTQSELFAAFDPGVFAHQTPAALAPAAAVGNRGTEIKVFGWSFTLGASSYALALSLAFAVGVIFNLMPCVLPVVPLKALGFYEASRHSRARSLLLGSVFSLGLMAAFAVLAVLVIVYQAAWGQQFSKPWFVWSMVVLLSLFACGMFGAFSVILPSGVYRFAPSHQTYTGNFLFGAFAALLSTPCTAPMFVGLLIWAGQQPRWLGVASVMQVGLGMASPYLVLSAFPELARRFPRTGPWSELVKQLMGFLILAVAVYFAAGRLISGVGFFWAVYAVLAAACIFLIVRTLMLAGSRMGRIIPTAVAVLALVGGFWFTRKLTTEGVPWQPYSQAAFDAARQKGRVVMVEFTANWCANCLELEARVFRDPRTAESIRRLDVVALRADLTQETAAGWPALRQLNPSGGIPLTAVYPPGAGSPELLSSIYTTENLLQALTQAAGDGAAK